MSTHKHIASTTLLNRELMRLADASHGLLLCGYSVMDDEFVYRWLGDGKMVVFRLQPADLLLSLNDLDDKLDPAIKEWREASPVEDAPGEYARLARNAGMARLDWAEDRLNRG